MKTFKTFFESKEDYERVPSPMAGESFTNYLPRLEGITIQDVLNFSTFQGLYLGNKYGLGGPAAGLHGAMKDFTDSLVKFVNKDDQGRGPDSFRPRAYESEEFKQQNNYDEYVQLDTLRRKAMRAKFDARKAQDDQALAAAEAEYARISQQLGETEYWQAYDIARKEEDDYVNNMHNTPMSREKLADDGTEDYRALEVSYDRLLQYL